MLRWTVTSVGRLHVIPRTGFTRLLSGHGANMAPGFLPSGFGADFVSRCGVLPTVHTIGRSRHSSPDTGNSTNAATAPTTSGSTSPSPATAASPTRSPKPSTQDAGSTWRDNTTRRENQAPSPCPVGAPVCRSAFTRLGKPALPGRKSPQDRLLRTASGGSTEKSKRGQSRDLATGALAGKIVVLVGCGRVLEYSVRRTWGSR